MKQGCVCVCVKQGCVCVCVCQGGVGGGILTSAYDASLSVQHEPTLRLHGALRRRAISLGNKQGFENYVRGSGEATDAAGMKASPPFLSWWGGVGGAGRGGRRCFCGKSGGCLHLHTKTTKQRLQNKQESNRFDGKRSTRARVMFRSVSSSCARNAQVRIC